MKVRLRKNIKYALPEKEYSLLVPGREYTVYGMLSSKDKALDYLYYICDDSRRRQCIR